MLTNRSKVVSKKEMSLSERLYLPAIASGLSITFKHIFKKIFEYHTPLNE